MPQLTESALASYDLLLAASRGADGATAARMLAPQRAMVLYLDAQVRPALDKVAALHPPIAPRIAYAPLQEAAARLDEQELSAHIDDTARMLQHSSTSLEQIGASLRQSADDAGVAAGVGRENADAATRTAVNQADSMTQRNVGLVEQTATAARGLEHQARVLAERVARFTLPTA